MVNGILVTDTDCQIIGDPTSIMKIIETFEKAKPQLMQIHYSALEASLSNLSDEQLEALVSRRKESKGE